MSNTFKYVKYDSESVAKQEAFKAMFEAIEDYANLTLTDSRPKSLLKTALEEAYMWTGKALRDDQMNKYSDLCSSVGQVAPQEFKKHREERG